MSVLVKFRNSDINIKCDEELMGKNSVIPWITDKAKISITSKKLI